MSEQQSQPDPNIVHLSETAVREIRDYYGDQKSRRDPDVVALCDSWLALRIGLTAMTEAYEESVADQTEIETLRRERDQLQAALKSVDLRLDVLGLMLAAFAPHGMDSSRVGDYHFAQDFRKPLDEAREIIRTAATTDLCWCCGEPAPIRGEGDPWEGRLDGYCDSCASTRCDTSDSVCAVKGRPKGGVAAGYQSETDVQELAVQIKERTEILGRLRTVERGEFTRIERYLFDRVASLRQALDSTRARLVDLDYDRANIEGQRDELREHTDTAEQLLQELYDYTGNLFQYAHDCEKIIEALGGEIPDATAVHNPISGAELGKRIRDFLAASAPDTPKKYEDPSWNRKGLLHVQPSPEDK